MTTKRDKEIMGAILNYIGSDEKLEYEFAKWVGTDFDMSEEEFSDWLMSVGVE